MRILFAGMPAYGHLYPLMPLFLACAERGHDVEMATGPPFAGRLRVPTVPVGSWTTLDDAEAEVKRRHPEVADLPPPERYRFGIELFADVGAGHFAEALIELLEAQRPDLVVYEATAVGAGVAAQITGIPAVAHGVVRWGFFTAALHQTVLERQRDSWTRRQLQPPPIDGVLADCFLDLTPAALGDDSAPLPPRTLPIRPVPWNEQLTAVPDWLAEPRQRPRVYVTLGTVVFSYVDALRTAVEGAANLGADVLVTVGPEGDPAGLGRLGDNVHVERFAPQSEVLPLVDAVVHHGGTGTMLGAAYHGLPQVLIPQGADQFQNAAALTAAGVARSFAGAELTADAITAALGAMLAGGPEAAATRALRAEIAAMPGPAERVSLLEEVASAA